MSLPMPRAWRQVDALGGTESELLPSRVMDFRSNQ